MEKSDLLKAMILLDTIEVTETARSIAEALADERRVASDAHNARYEAYLALDSAANILEQEVFKVPSELHEGIKYSVLILRGVSEMFLEDK